MRCEPFREALSARLDGEEPGLAEGRIDDHLAGCGACASWLEGAAEVTRRARLVPAEPAPDVTAAVLAALPAAPRRRRRRWVDAALRGGLLAASAGQVLVGLPALVGGTAPMADPMSAPVHMAHETGAWNLGLAACFLLVAARPRLAAGALPFLLSFTGVLSWVTVSDLDTGAVHAGRAVAHVFLLLGALLVSVLALRGRSAGSGPGGARRMPRTTSREPAGQRSAAAGLLRVPALPAPLRSGGAAERSDAA